MGLGVGFSAAKNLLIGTLGNSLTVLLKLDAVSFNNSTPRDLYKRNEIYVYTNVYNSHKLEAFYVH